MNIKIKTLTPIWTGDVDRKCSKIKETGIIGSLRWWYEALVRGYGGYACDPSNSECKFDYDTYKKTKNIEDGLKKVCPVCRLFGCTGWSRRFRLEVNNVDGNFDRYKGFKSSFDMTLIELYPLNENQLWLLWQTFYIIGKYGTIGGKCMLKPSTNPKTGKYCEDRGQVEVVWGESNFEKPNLKTPSVETMIKENKSIINKENNDMWPNLKYFLFSPDESLDSKNFFDLQKAFPDFIKGDKDAYPPRANKFASFKNGKRLWGYTKADENMYKEVSEKLKELGIKNIIKGEEVIENEL